MIRIKKVKITKHNRINIQYEKQNKNTETWDEYSLTCSDEPRPEFRLALARLATHVVEMCELPYEYKSRIIVNGVTFSYGGESETMGATIISQMELENSNTNLNLNTPHKGSEFYGDPKQLLTDECIDDLEELIKEVELYIEGERAQMNLFQAI